MPRRKPIYAVASQPGPAPLVVVTGASGHLGANLVRALLAAGQRVRAVVHLDERAVKGLAVQVARASLDDVDALRAAFAGADVVYQCSGYVSIRPGDARRLKAVNVDGTANVVAACRSAGVRRLVHFSSIEALGPPAPGRPLDEAVALVGPGAAGYARSKALGEALVRDAVSNGLDAVVINPTAMLGPFDYRLSRPNQGLLVMCCKPVPVLLDAGFDWVDVRDVATAAISAAATAPAGRRYILSGQRARMRELRLMAQPLTGAKIPRLTCPMWLARVATPAFDLLSLTGVRGALLTSPAVQPMLWKFDISHALANRELGYAPRPLRDTVLDTLRWFKEHPVS